MLQTTTLALFLAFPVTPGQDLAQDSHEIVVDVRGLAPSEGKLVVVLWKDAEGFPFAPGRRSVLRSERLEIPAGSDASKAPPRDLKVTFPDVPAGRYALSASLDLDDSGGLELDYLGEPLEPFATGLRKTSSTEYRRASFEVRDDTTRVLELSDVPDLEGRHDLLVEAGAIEGKKGSVRFCLWSQKKGFPVDVKSASVIATLRADPASARAKRKGDPRLASVLFRAVPKGTYALTVFHDEDDDGKIDRSFIGRPTEPVGVSNNPKPRMGAPSYKSCKFELTRASELEVTLR